MTEMSSLLLLRTRALSYFTKRKAQSSSESQNIGNITAFCKKLVTHILEAYRICLQNRLHYIYDKQTTGFILHEEKQSSNNFIKDKVIKCAMLKETASCIRKK